MTIQVRLAIAAVLAMCVQSAAAADGSHALAYLTNLDEGAVEVFDTGSHQIVGRVSVGENPRGVAIHPDGSRVYITNTNSNNVSIIETAGHTVTSTIAVGDSPWGIVISPDGSRLYVANASSATVSVIETNGNAVTATIPIGVGPREIAINPTGTRIYVTNLVDDTLSVIDTGNNTVIATVPMPRNPFGVAVQPDGGRVWVSNGTVPGSVVVVNTATNTADSTITLPVNSPQDVAFDDAGNRAFLTTFNGELFVLDTTAAAITGSLQVEDFSDGVTISDDGQRLYIVNGIRGTLSVVDTSQLRMIASVALPGWVSSTGDFLGAGSTNGPSAPAFITPPQVFVVEGQTEIIDVETSDDLDAEGAGIAYSFTAQVNPEQFSLDPETGTLSFVEPPEAIPFFGNRSDVRSLTIIATDSQQQVSRQAVKVHVLPSSGTPQDFERQITCLDLDQAIPDMGASVARMRATLLTDSLSPLAAAGRIARLATTVEANHSWPGDLRFALHHARHGTLALLDNPGSGFCLETGIALDFDDGALMSIQACSSLQVLMGETRPADRLDFLIGRPVENDDWYLQVQDLVSLDDGTLTRWCVDLWMSSNAELGYPNARGALPQRGDRCLFDEYLGFLQPWRWLDYTPPNEGVDQTIAITTPGLIVQGFNTDVVDDPTLPQLFSVDTCSEPTATLAVPNALHGTALKLRFSACDPGSTGIDSIRRPFTFNVTAGVDRLESRACTAIPFGAGPGLVISGMEDSRGLYDGESGEPVAFATVSAGNNVVFSDAQGAFSLALTAGPSTIHISHPDYRFETIELQIEADATYEIEVPMFRRSAVPNPEIIFVSTYE